MRALKSAGLLGTMVISAVVVGANTTDTSVVPAVNTLFRAELDGIDGWEASVASAVQKPGAAAGWHYHNGHEIVFVHEGSLVFELKGQPPMNVKAGDVIYIPRRVPHRAHNASDTQPYRLVAFAMDEKGKPQRVELKD